MKKNNFTKVLVLFTLIVVFTQPVYAYLDPGTGSYIFQVVVASCAGAVFAVKIFWNNIKAFFSSIFLKKD